MPFVTDKIYTKVNGHRMYSGTEGNQGQLG